VHSPKRDRRGVTTACIAAPSKPSSVAGTRHQWAIGCHSLPRL
ncbi:MAG: hypothetical protein AVDCRST_MAG93-10044, partial [uncultured Chloroflexia bacterium]